MTEAVASKSFQVVYINLIFCATQGIADEVDAETEEVLNEFSFLGAEEASSSDKSEEWSYSGARADDVSLGELAQLTVNNDADISMDVSVL